TRSGSMVVLLVVMSLSLAPGTLTPILKKNPALMREGLAVLRYTPPFGAAAAMTHQSADALLGLGLIAGWAAALAVTLVALERRPARPQQVARGVGNAGGSVWNGPFDRVAALFGPRMAPLVGFW